ncbi:MAG: 8-oxo-dGTP diphosphatase [Nanoarchaeota archaeon]|nr:8-oxo-dGTP diphosphatase [Nanoarchaeota archaeon]
MRPVTLVYCIRGNSVLFGMKKRGFGSGKLNGYGGKVDSGEKIIDSAVRELFEEARILCRKKDLKKVAEIDFYFNDIPKEKGWNQTVHVYILRKWLGEVEETEEMTPEWHKISKIPLDKMWIDDEYWLPLILKGKKIKASFVFDQEGESIKKYQIAETRF